MSLTEGRHRTFQENQPGPGQARRGQVCGQLRSYQPPKGQLGSPREAGMRPQPQPELQPGNSQPRQGKGRKKRLTRLCFATAGAQAWHVLSRDWGGCVSQPQSLTPSYLQLAPCSDWAWPPGRPVLEPSPRLDRTNQPAQDQSETSSHSATFRCVANRESGGVERRTFILGRSLYKIRSSQGTLMLR